MFLEAFDHKIAELAMPIGLQDGNWIIWLF